MFLGFGLYPIKICLSTVRKWSMLLRGLKEVINTNAYSMPAYSDVYVMKDKENLDLYHLGTL